MRSLAVPEHIFEADFQPLLDSKAARGYFAGSGGGPLRLIDRKGLIMKSERGRTSFTTAVAARSRTRSLQNATIRRNRAGRDRADALAARLQACRCDLSIA